MIYGNRVCISSRFRDNRPQTFWGHDLDISRSRDVIDQVTNRFAIGYFLFVVHCNQVSVSKRNLNGSMAWSLVNYTEVCVSSANK